MGINFALDNTGIPVGLEIPILLISRCTDSSIPSPSKVSQGAQEIFRLLPHRFVKPSDLPQLYETPFKPSTNGNASSRDKANFQIYGCVVDSRHMVAPNDPGQQFDKADYYAHPEDYHSIFHETIAPYTSVIVNCMYWERRFPRLLTNEQLQELTSIHTRTDTHGKWLRFLGVADITCDVQGSIEAYTKSLQLSNHFSG